ncbi:unnamed protein product [Durusdinium trenchii]|uniref:Uncharacterized protein n=1 Tax=Durusdinium trenchii TaxID=1381693 RepID=A0ABP0JIW6_9DINO
MVEVHTPRLRRSLSRKRPSKATVQAQEPPTLLNRRSLRIPCASVKVFAVEGYGAELIRRVLHSLGWQEREASATPGHPPQLLWNGSTSGRKLFKDEVIQPWQILNHFPKSGVIGSKSGLLWNLRDHCALEAKMPLMSFMPRSYDLRSSRELRGFLLDFAVTKAESMLEVNGTLSPPAASGVLQACRLLGRLSHAQVLQSQVLCGQRASFRDFQEGLGFTHEDEWVLRSGSTSAEAQALLLRLMAEKEQEEGLILSAVVLEARWWRDHLQQQEQRQSSLNGVHGFWVLKEPNLNCGRGVRVFSELLPLLQEAELADWHVIVQKYIERPLLVAQKKCDLRLWVVVTSWNPAVVWVWPEPYLRLASRPFTWEDAQIADPYVHLTNRTVQRHDAPEEKASDEDEAHIMMLPAFLKWAEELENLNALSCWKERTWPKILEVVRTCVLSCKEDVGAHPRGCFELFGFDFLLDCDFTPWLLEANSSPDLCEDAGPSLRRMTETALTQLFELVQGLFIEETITFSGAGKFDCPVPGSGDWHLILREETSRGTKDLELRRAVRASRRPPSVSTAQSRTQHRDVLRATLGCSGSKRPEHKEMGFALQPKELILVPQEPCPRQEPMRAMHRFGARW